MVFSCDFALVLAAGYHIWQSGLQFEWAWQHPDRSRLLRSLLSDSYPKLLTASSAVLKRVTLVLAMCHAQPFVHYPLHVRFGDSDTGTGTGTGSRSSEHWKLRLK